MDIANLDPDLDLFKSIFRNFPVSEMPAVQFNNYENLLNSFEHKHNEEMNGKNTYAFI